MFGKLTPKNTSEVTSISALTLQEAGPSHIDPLSPLSPCSSTVPLRHRTSDPAANVQPVELGPSADILCRFALCAVCSATVLVSVGVFFKVTAHERPSVNEKTIASFVGLLLGGCAIGIGLMTSIGALFVKRRQRIPERHEPLLDETTRHR